MKRIVTCILLLCAAALYLLPAARAAGFYNSYQHLVGDRAAGMGGAFTAAANDGSSLWYNPAGLAGVENLDISLSGNAYSYLQSKTSGYFRIERPGTPGVFENIDLKESDISAVATSMAFGKRIEGIGTIAAGVFVPYQDNLTGLLSGGVIGTAGQKVYMQSRYSNQSKMLAGMLGWGKSFFDRLNIGASLAVGYYNENFDDTEFFYIQENINSYNQTYRNTQEEKSVMLSAVAGLQFRITDNHTVGVRVSAPYFNLWGRSRITDMTLEAGTIVTPVMENYDRKESYDTFEKVMPGMYSAGYAFTLPGKFTLSAEAELVDTTWDTARNVVNYKAGAEVFLSETMVLRAGFFTDFSQMRGVDYNILSDNDERIDYYGGTVSLSMAALMSGGKEGESGLRIKKTWTTVGMVYRHGEGQVRTYAFTGAYDFLALRKNTSVNHFSFFVGETVSF